MKDSLHLSGSYYLRSADHWIASCHVDYARDKDLSIDDINNKENRIDKNAAMMMLKKAECFRCKG